MKQIIKILTVLAVVMALTACATTARDGYNTQLGASLGAGFGAIGGQLVGGSAGATLIGAALGSLFGAIVGSEVDQEQLAAEDAALRGRGRDDRELGGTYSGRASRRTDCRKGTDPAWEEEPLISGRVNETGEYDDAFGKRYR
jgi:hypothetical protein